MRCFLDVHRSAVAQETGTVKGYRFTALQAAKNFYHAVLLTAGLDYLLLGLAVANQINHLAGRAQHDRLLRYDDRVLLLAGDDCAIDRGAAFQAAGVLDARNDFDGAIAFADGRAKIFDKTGDHGVGASGLTMRTGMPSFRRGAADSGKGR